jgi:hypothetical protein
MANYCRAVTKIPRGTRRNKKEYLTVDYGKKKTTFFAKLRPTKVTEFREMPRNSM